MGRTAKIMGTVLHSEVVARITQSDRMMETLSRALSMSMQVRQMIDAQIASALQRDPERAALLNRINELEARVARLEGARQGDQSSKASS